MTEPATKGAVYDDLHQSDDFRDLRSRYRRFAIPWTIAFLGWYMLYVVCSNWATDFMSADIVGNINVALVFGLLQFLSTFLIAYLYARYSTKRLDPVATKLRDEFEAEIGR